MADKVIGVITLAEFPGKGGDTANYLEITKQLIREGFEVVLICPRVAFEAEKPSNLDGPEIVRIPYKPLCQISNVSKYRRYIEYFFFVMAESLVVYSTLRRKGVKYVIMRHSILTMLLPLMLRLMRIKVMADGDLIREHSELERRGKFLAIVQAFERKAISLYSFLKVSTSAHARALENAGLKYEKIVLIPVSVDIDKIPKFPLSEIPEHTFGYFGVLEPWQGIDILIDSFKIVVARIPTAILYIIGEGSQGDYLKDKVLRENIASNIIFVKSIAREELWNDYFSKFRIVVIPRPQQNKSIDYFLPIKLVESMAAAKPIIAIDLPYTREIPNCPLYLVKAAEPELLATAMEALSKDIHMMEELARNALVEAGNFDIKRNARKIISTLLNASCKTI